MIDNLEKILPILNFTSNDDFYYLQILQRKKENKLPTSNSRVIKNYYIRSEKYLLDRYDEIKKICDIFNARASLRLNKRSYRKVAYKSMVNIANTMSNREFLFVGKSYDRACGSTHNDDTKKWILDIDEGDFEKDSNMLISNIINYINTIEPMVVDKHIATIPSKTGMHLITTPFNVQKFKINFPTIEIHKDNPTNLYIS